MIKRDFILKIYFGEYKLKSIYVGNMPYTASREQISELFSKYGKVHGVKIIMDRDSQKPKGFCFVEMEDNEAIEAINNLNDKEFLGRTLRVNEAKSKN